MAQAREIQCHRSVGQGPEVRSWLDFFIRRWTVTCMGTLCLSSFSNGTDFCLSMASPSFYSRNSISNLFTEPVCAGCCRNTWVYFSPDPPSRVFMCCDDLHWTDEETGVQRLSNWWKVTQLVSGWAGICTKAVWPFYTQGSMSMWAKMTTFWRKSRKVN